MFFANTNPMTILDNLLDLLADRPSRHIVARDPRNYEAFLSLYARVGYAPASEEERHKWRETSTDTWKYLDEVLPATYTGGPSGQLLVSGAGTLPMSPTVVYGHSWCMERTLDAAATLYSQALYSLQWIDRFPDATHWAGSYVYQKRFVRLLQKEPLTAPIPEQIEVDVLRCSFVKNVDDAPRSGLVIEEEEGDPSLLSVGSRLVYGHLRSSHPLLCGLHSVRQLTVRDVRTRRPIAFILLHEAKPELTAINIFSRGWLFSLDRGESPIELAKRLWASDMLGGKMFEIVLEQRVSDSAAIVTSEYKHTFWAFTPRASLPDLKESFRAAFKNLLRRYSSEDLQSLYGRLSQV